MNLCGDMGSAFDVNQSNTLHRVFAPHLCHCGQTHRFRRCLSAAMGALEYPKKNSRNGNKDELYFTLSYMDPLSFVIIFDKHIRVSLLMQAGLSKDIQCCG